MFIGFYTVFGYYSLLFCKVSERKFSFMRFFEDGNKACLFLSWQVSGLCLFPTEI